MIISWGDVAVSVVLAVTGFLLLRAITQLDTTVADFGKDLAELKADRKAQIQLNEFLNKRLVVVEAENTTFRRIIAALDKIIYSKLGVNISDL